MADRDRLCGRRRDEQLPAGEHRHVRDAADVRRDHPRLELRGDLRRVPREQDLLQRRRGARLRPDVLPGGSGLQRRAGLVPRSRTAHAVDHRRWCVPDLRARTGVLAQAEGPLGEGRAGRQDPGRSEGVRHAGPLVAGSQLRREGRRDRGLPGRVFDPGHVRLGRARDRLELGRERDLGDSRRRRRDPGRQQRRPARLHGWRDRDGLLVEPAARDLRDQRPLRARARAAHLRLDGRQGSRRDLLQRREREGAQTETRRARAHGRRADDDHVTGSRTQARVSEDRPRDPDLG